MSTKHSIPKGKGSSDPSASADCMSMDAVSKTVSSSQDTTVSLVASTSRQSEAASFELNAADIEFGKRLAVGGFAEVFIGSFEGTLVAIKKLLDQDFDAASIERFKQEVRILTLMRHPNLILFIGYVSTPYLAIVSEFMARGSLYQILRKRQGVPLDVSMQQKIVISIARGCAYLHSRNPPILHLDLKSPNILVDERWHIKIADFGLSRSQYNSLMSSGTAGGTAEWMAPEILRNEQYDDRADVYSFGVVIWELITCKIPWEGLNQMQVVGMTGYQRRMLPTPEKGDPFLIRLFTMCCANDPQRRPSMSEVIKLFEASCGRDTLGPGANMFALTNPNFGYLDAQAAVAPASPIAPPAQPAMAQAPPAVAQAPPAPTRGVKMSAEALSSPSKPSALETRRQSLHVPFLPSLPEDSDALFMLNSGPTSSKAMDGSPSFKKRYASMTYQELMDDKLRLRSTTDTEGGQAFNLFADMTGDELLAHTLTVTQRTEVLNPFRRSPELTDKLSLSTAIRGTTLALNPYSTLSPEELMCIPIAIPAPWIAPSATDAVAPPNLLCTAPPLPAREPPSYSATDKATLDIKAWTEALASATSFADAYSPSAPASHEPLSGYPSLATSWSDLESRPSFGTFKRMHSSAISDMRAALASHEAMRKVAADRASARAAPASVPASPAATAPDASKHLSEQRSSRAASLKLIPDNLAAHPAVQKFKFAIHVGSCKAAIMCMLAQRQEAEARAAWHVSIDKRKEAATERTVARTGDGKTADEIEACNARALQLEDEARDSDAAAAAANHLMLSAKSSYVLFMLKLKSRVGALRQFVKCLPQPDAVVAGLSSEGTEAKSSAVVAEECREAMAKMPAHFRQVVEVDINLSALLDEGAQTPGWQAWLAEGTDQRAVEIAEAQRLLVKYAEAGEARADELTSNAAVMSSQADKIGSAAEARLINEEADAVRLQAEGIRQQARVERAAAEALRGLAGDDEAEFSSTVEQLRTAMEAPGILQVAGIVQGDDEDDLASVQPPFNSAAELTEAAAVENLQMMLSSQKLALNDLEQRTEMLRKSAQQLREQKLEGAIACEERIEDLTQQRRKLEIVIERLTAQLAAAREQHKAVQERALSAMRSMDPQAALSVSLVEDANDLNVIASVSSHHSSVHSQRSIKLHHASSTKLAAAETLRNMAREAVRNAERMRTSDAAAAERAETRSRSLSGQASEMESLASIDIEIATKSASKAMSQLAEATAANQLSKHLHRSALSLSNYSRSGSGSTRSWVSNSSGAKSCQDDASPGTVDTNSNTLRSSDRLQSGDMQKLANAWQAVYMAEGRAQLHKARGDTALKKAAATSAEAAELEKKLGELNLDADTLKAAHERIEALRREAAELKEQGDADLQKSAAMAEEAQVYVKEAMSCAVAGVSAIADIADDDEPDSDAASDDAGNADVDWEAVAKESWDRYTSCEQYASKLKMRSDAKTWQAVSLRSDAEKQALLVEELKRLHEGNWQEAQARVEALHRDADELEASAAQDVLHAITARLNARAAEKVAMNAQQRLDAAHASNSAGSASSNSSNESDYVIAKRQEQQQLKMRLDAKTVVAQKLETEAQEQAQGAAFMRQNNIEGWQDVQKNADKLFKAAMRMAESYKVDLADWETGKRNIETLVSQVSTTTSGQATSTTSGQTPELYEGEDVHHSRDERNANALSRSKAALAAEFLARSNAKKAMAATMREGAASKNEAAKRMRDSNQLGWQALLKEAADITANAEALERSANADAVSARTHHMESVEATIQANHANKAIRDSRSTTTPVMEGNAQLRNLRQQIKSALHKKVKCTEQADAMDAQAADKVKEATKMRGDAALQKRGADFMRDNKMPGWEIAQAKADALNNTASTMEQAADDDRRQAQDLRLAADAAEDMAQRARQSMLEIGGEGCVFEPPSGDAVTEASSGTHSTGNSKANLMSTQLQEASNAETARSFALAEQASMLQARANIRRTQAEVLRKQADDQRKGAQFMRTHNMPGWEGSQIRADGLVKAAQEMEAQANADEDESLKAAAEARAAAESAQNASLESHLQARLESTADVDFSIAATATVSTMEYENQALSEVWSLLGLDKVTSSERVICQAVIEHMMTSIAKRAYDNQVDLAATKEEEVTQRMASTAKHIANVTGLRADADQQAAGAKFMNDNNMLGWEVAQNKADEFNRLANEAELNANADSNLAREARQAKNKALADSKEAKVAWEAAKGVEAYTEADWEKKARDYSKSAVERQADYAANSAKAAMLLERARTRESHSLHLRRQAEMQAMGYKFIMDSTTSDAAARAAAAEGLTMADEYAKQADKLMASSDRDLQSAQRYNAKAQQAQAAIEAAYGNESDAWQRAASKNPNSEVHALLAAYSRLKGTELAPSTPVKERSKLVEATASESGSAGTVGTGSMSEGTDAVTLCTNLGVYAYKASLLCMHLAQEASSLRTLASTKMLASQTLHTDAQEAWRTAQRARARKQSGWQKELARARSLQAQVNADAAEAQTASTKAADLVRQAAHAACIACELGSLASCHLESCVSHEHSGSEASSSQASSSRTSAYSYANKKADEFSLQASKLSAASARTVLEAITRQDTVGRKLKQAWHLRKQAHLLTQGAGMLQRIKLEGWVLAEASVKSLLQRAARLDDSAAEDVLENEQLTREAHGSAQRAGQLAMKAAALRAVIADAHNGRLNLSLSMLHSVVLDDENWKLPLDALRQNVLSLMNSVPSSSGDSLVLRMPHVSHDAVTRRARSSRDSASSVVARCLRAGSGSSVASLERVSQDSASGLRFMRVGSGSSSEESPRAGSRRESQTGHGEAALKDAPSLDAASQGTSSLSSRKGASVASRSPRSTATSVAEPDSVQKLRFLQHVLDVRQAMEQTPARPTVDNAPMGSLASSGSSAHPGSGLNSIPEEDATQSFHLAKETVTGGPSPGSSSDGTTASGSSGCRPTAPISPFALVQLQPPPAPAAATSDFQKPATETQKLTAMSPFQAGAQMPAAVHWDDAVQKSGRTAAALDAASPDAATGGAIPLGGFHTRRSAEGEAPDPPAGSLQALSQSDTGASIYQLHSAASRLLVDPKRQTPNLEACSRHSSLARQASYNNAIKQVREGSRRHSWSIDGISAWPARSADGSVQKTGDNSAAASREREPPVGAATET